VTDGTHLRLPEELDGISDPTRGRCIRMADKKVTPAKPASSKDSKSTATTAASRVTKKRSLKKRNMKRVHAK
jgi:hypothetical protein